MPSSRATNATAGTCSTRRQPSSVPPMRWHHHRSRQPDICRAPSKDCLIHPECEPMSRKSRRRGAASVVRAERVRVDPAEAEQRFAERDQREAADTRTEAQRWLNDPPPSRSALAAKQLAKSSILDKKLRISEQLVKPPTELRVLQPPTEFGEHMWVDKQNIKN